MILIVAVDENWGIGNNGELLISLPEDQKGVFRKYTIDNTVVFGRKTLKTFKDEKLLPKRKNIVMSRNKDFAKEGALVIHSEEELLDYKLNHADEKIFIIGGEQVYKTMLDYCDEAIVTFIHERFEADAYFPNLDINENWELVSEEEEVHSVKGVSFNVRHYRNKGLSK